METKYNLRAAKLTSKKKAVITIAVFLLFMVGYFGYKYFNSSNNSASIVKIKEPQAPLNENVKQDDFQILKPTLTQTGQIVANDDLKLKNALDEFTSVASIKVSLFIGL